MEAKVHEVEDDSDGEVVDLEAELFFPQHFRSDVVGSASQ